MPLSEAFLALSKLSERLIARIADGRGDDDDTDALRDQMDAPWRLLREDERELLNQLAADLYTLWDEPASGSSMPDTQAQELRALRDNCSWREALAYATRHPRVLSAVDAADLRNDAWAALGHHELARRFSTQAYVLRESMPKRRRRLQKVPFATLAPCSNGP